MDNYRSTKVNRYWKRPKPKVYDCNVRDAERFYQDSYKRYLSEKEEAAARAARARSIDTDKVEFYPHLRAGPIRREASGRSSASHSELPPLPSSLSEGLRSRLDSERSATETSFTNRSDGLPSYDPSQDSLNLDERLNRLKKLREELGLPSEASSSVASSLRSESASRSAAGGPTDFESSYKSDRTTRSLAKAAPEETSTYNFKSEKSSRMNGTGGLGEDYKFKSERSTGDYKFKSDSTTGDYKLPTRSVDFELPKIERKPLNLSPKLDRKKNDYSFSSSSEKKADRFSSLSSSTAASSSATTAGRSSRKAKDNLEIDDDDTSVVDMMKKLPSSQDILERISKMDLDD